MCATHLSIQVKKKILLVTFFNPIGICDNVTHAEADNEDIHRSKS